MRFALIASLLHGDSFFHRGGNRKQPPSLRGPNADLGVHLTGTEQTTAVLLTARSREKRQPRDAFGARGRGKRKTTRELVKGCFLLADHVRQVYTPSLSVSAGVLKAEFPQLFLRIFRCE